MFVITDDICYYHIESFLWRIFMELPQQFGWMMDDILYTATDNSIDIRPDEDMNEAIDDVIDQVGGFTVKPIQV